MSTADASRPVVPAGTALYIAVVQFLFVTTWTTYVIYLPRLLESAGLPAAWTPRLLLVDQFVFMVADVASGVAADRVQRTLGRLGPWMVGAMAVSCLAFLLLPHVVRLGPAGQVPMFGLMLVWTATSSALRAPPWVLLGRYAARPALPGLNALTLLGLAAGSAIAPFLGVALRGVDPRLPFALSSLTLLAVTAGLVAVERGLARKRTGAGAATSAETTTTATATSTLATKHPQTPQVLGARHAAWMAGILLLAAAFQTHQSLNTAAQFLRFARPDELEHLTPLFWVGFAAAMVPAGALCKRHGALPVMTASALLAAGAALAAAGAGSLGVLIAAQLVAGAVWGGMLTAMFTSAADLGRAGREGLALGTMFAMLALATLARIAAVLSGMPKDPAMAPMLAWAPAVLWAVGGGVIGALAWRGRPQDAAPGA